MNPQATFDLLFSISTAVAIAVRRVRVPYTVALVLVGLVRGMFHFVAAALRPTRERLPSGWPTVLTWGGLRGALAMVLALALPLELPHRDQLIAMTFGVVLLSLAFQGMSMAWLPSRLGLVRVHSGAALHERARVTLRAVDVSLQELARLRRSHEAPPRRSTPCSSGSRRERQPRGSNSTPSVRSRADCSVARPSARSAACSSPSGRS